MRNPVRRENLFLIELVGCLLLFALCAAVCTGLLFRAHAMSRESTELTDAVYLAQSAAETWKAGQAPAGDWGDYRVTCEVGAEDASPRTCDITVWLDGVAVYKLEGVAAP